MKLVNFISNTVGFDISNILVTLLFVLSFVVAPLLILIIYNRLPNILNNIVYTIEKDLGYLRVEGIDHITLLDGSKKVRVSFSTDCNFRFKKDLTVLQSEGITTTSTFECEKYIYEGGNHKMNKCYGANLGVTFNGFEYIDSDSGLEKAKKSIETDFKNREYEKIMVLSVPIFIMLVILVLYGISWLA